MDKHENSKDHDIMIMITMIMIFIYLFIYFILLWIFVVDVYSELTPDLCEYQDLSPNLRWMMKLDPVHKENNLQFCY